MSAPSSILVRRSALPNGFWGMALLAATEAALFGALIATYEYLRVRAPAWPPAGVEEPTVALPLALTGALVLSTAPQVAAWRAARRGSLRATCAALVLATAVQAGYLAVQIVLYVGDLGDIDPRESAYGSSYFTVLTVHHAHVVVGLLLNFGVLARLAGGLNDYRAVGVRSIALYWCFVNVAAIAVELCLLSPSL